MASQVQLSLDSVTQVLNSSVDFGQPLSRDLQKIMQAINEARRDIAALQAAPAPVTPVTPVTLGDFAVPPGADFRDDGAMDFAVQALTLSDIPPSTALSPQIIFCTQATFPSLPTVPAGTLIAVTDYAHLIYWDGTTPVFMDGGNCFIALFDIDPGTGWHLLDGTVGVTYLKADGTLGTYTVEDATIAFFLEAGLVNSGPTAAVAPTFTGTPATPAGTVSASTFTGTPATPAGTVSAPVFTGTSNPGVAVAAGAGTQVVGAPYTPLGTNNAPTFTGTPATPAGTNSTPIFTGTPATPAGTISATGEPRKIIRRPYFRQ